MKRFFKKLFCKHIYKQLEGDPTFFYCVKCTKERTVSNPDKILNKKKKNLPVNTIIKVYKGTPTLEQGEVSLILDYDSINKDYAIAPLSSVEKHKGDLFTLLEKQSKWIKRENFEVITFDKPKYKYLKYLIPALTFAIALNLSEYI